MDVSRMFQACFEKVYFKSASKVLERKFHKCSKEVSRLFQGNFKNVSKMFLSRFKGVSRKFCFLIFHDTHRSYTRRRRACFFIYAVVYCGQHETNKTQRQNSPFLLNKILMQCPFLSTLNPNINNESSGQS